MGPAGEPKLPILQISGFRRYSDTTSSTPTSEHMPRAQTPLKLAYATGRADVNPGRFKGRGDAKPQQSPELGDPPHSFTLQERAVWYENRARYWWLDETDRDLYAAFCRMCACVRDPEVFAEPAYWNIYIRLSAMLGIAPTTRGKMLQDRGLGGNGDDDDEL